MANEEKLFHESWHRIANQKISLRSSVRITRQIFRGEKWYVVADPFSNNFYRLRPPAYDFVSRLNPTRTVEDVWSDVLNRDPENAPGQGDIIELLAQLYHANLLHYELAPDSAKLFERFKKKKQRILRANLSNIMFFRIPLLDPSQFINRLEPILKMLISPITGLLWLAIIGVAVRFAIDNFAELREQSQGILAPSNLFLLYVGVVIIKAFHEFGHAFMVRRFGGEVHTIGVMFLIFSPLPYMDASAAWLFRNKWHRILVSAAGMILELFIAAIATIIWANTGAGILHSLMYNMIFAASVSTLVFNLMPLLRYDGYYILSDLLNIPNLHQQSWKQITYAIEHFAYKCKDSENPSSNWRDAFWLSTFGISSTIYRFIVFGGILLFIADRFLLAGVVMAIICAIAWVVVPIVKFVKYLASDPRLERTRSRAILVTATTFGCLVIVLNIIPFPWSCKAPGVLKAAEYASLVNETSGVVAEILAVSGTRVTPGTPLVRLENGELAQQIIETRGALQETEARHQKAMQELQADMKPITGRLEFLTKKADRLEKDNEKLIVKSLVGGVWVSPHLDDFKNMWIPRSTPIGQVINNTKFQFIAAVSQKDVSELFAGKVRSAKVRLRGQSETNVRVTSFKAIPMEQNELPSSALGWGGGGDIAVDVADRQGTKTTEPFYEVRASVDSCTKVSLYHGCSGKIRFALPMKPLMRQVWRALRQTIQKRYHV